MSAAFTFGFAPGTVLTDEVPAGYRSMRRANTVGTADAFDALGRLVLDWAVQRRSGIAVRDPAGRDAPPIEEGLEGRVVIPLVVAGALRFEVAAPVRVTRVLDGPDAIGFAYGTLPGHPEVGEESFVVRRRGPETAFELRSLSRQAFPYSLLGPVGRSMQDRFAERYLAALL